MDITFLQESFITVASSLTVNIYSMANGLTIQQAVANSPTLTATTDTNGHIQVSLTAGIEYAFAVTGYLPVQNTIPLLSSVIYIPVYVNAATTQIFGTLENDDGTPQIGATVAVSLNASGPVFSTNLILAQTKSVTTDSNGTWSLDLIPNDSITSPKNTLYTFIFTLLPPVQPVVPFFSYGEPVAPHGQTVSKIVRVPVSSAPVDFASLA